MNCDQALEAISAKLDGALDTAQEQELTAHLAQCADCRATYDALCGIERGMDTLVCDAPDGLAQAVMEQVRQEPRTAARRKPQLAGILAVAAVAAVLLLGLTGVVDVPGFGNRDKRSSASLLSVFSDASTAHDGSGFGGADYAALAEARGARVLVLWQADALMSELADAPHETYDSGTLYTLAPDAFEAVLRQTAAQNAQLFAPNDSTPAADAACYGLVFSD